MSTLGMAWYSPEAWRRLAAMPEARVQKTYGEFVSSFECWVREFTAQGIDVVPIAIDIDQMVEWCHRRGYEVDAHGRALYGVALQADPSPDCLRRTRVIQ